MTWYGSDPYANPYSSLVGRGDSVVDGGVVVDGVTSVAPLDSRSHAIPAVPIVNVITMTIPNRVGIRCITLSPAVSVSHLHGGGGPSRPALGALSACFHVLS